MVRVAVLTVPSRVSLAPAAFASPSVRLRAPFVTVLSTIPTTNVCVTTPSPNVSVPFVGT